MSKLNKKNEIEFVNEMKNYIENINSKIEKVILPNVNSNILDENIVDEEQNMLE